MPKEIYLYTPIYSGVAEQIVSQLEEYKNEDIVMRVSSPGGAVLAGWNIASKMIEHKGKITIKVDGAAFSMAMDLLPYADEVVANDVTRFMFHRGNAPVTSQQEQDFLDSINADLRAKFEKKVPAEKFKEATGYTYDEAFASNKQLDIFLTAKQVETMGLVDKIVPLDPKEAKALNDNLFLVAAMANTNTNDNNNNNKIMTIEEIKAKHPEVYNQIVALGITEGQKKERERVTAWLSFSSVDPDGVSKSIKEGKDFGMSDVAEMTAKMNSPEMLKKLAENSAATTTTKEVTTPGDDAKKTEQAEATTKFVSDAKKILTSNYL